MRITKEIRIIGNNIIPEWNFIYNGKVFVYGTEEKAIKSLMNFNHRKNVPRGYL